MKTTLTWSEKLRFSAAFGENSVAMDARAPIGQGTAPSPKELVLAGICGCTAMDIAMVLRKARQTPGSFAIEAKAEQTGGRPSVFKMVHLVYKVAGGVDEETLKNAVHESMTLDCGVSAMIAKVCPITYEVELDGKMIAKGEARFP